MSDNVFVSFTVNQPPAPRSEPRWRFWLDLARLIALVLLGLLGILND